MQFGRFLEIVWVEMKLETQKLNDQNEKTKTELVAQVHELKNLLRQLVDK